MVLRPCYTKIVSPKFYKILWSTNKYDFDSSRSRSNFNITCPVGGASIFLWDFPNGAHLETTENQISINMKIIEKTGIITCIAGNDFGAVMVEIELIPIQDKPIILEPSKRFFTGKDL